MTAKKKKAAARARLPGTPRKDAVLDRMLRVDLAGEYGATRIYAGQLRMLGKSRAAPALRHMAAQEDVHLEAFQRLVGERGARPSVLHPLWHVGGFALGAVTAALGEKAAMACTVAVEQVIDDHYRRQMETLEGMGEPALQRLIARFRAEENEHESTARTHGDGGDAPPYMALRAAVRALSRAAIAVAERI